MNKTTFLSLMLLAVLSAACHPLFHRKNASSSSKYDATLAHYEQWKKVYTNAPNLREWSVYEYDVNKDTSLALLQLNTARTLLQTWKLDPNKPTKPTFQLLINNKPQASIELEENAAKFSRTYRYYNASNKLIYTDFMQYDSKKHAIENLTTLHATNFVTKTRWTYDTQYRVLQEKITAKNEEDVYRLKLYEYFRNNKYRRVIDVSYRENKSDTLLYSEQSGLRERISYADGKLIKRQHVQGGSLTERYLELQKNGQFLLQEQIEYDKHNQIWLATTFNTTNNTAETIIWHLYDKHTRDQFDQKFKVKLAPTQIVYLYNDQKNIIGQLTYKNGKLTHCIGYDYIVK